MKRIYLLSLTVLIASLFFSGIALGATTSYTEDFEDEEVDTNPSAGWYTYSEYFWNYANVTDTANAPLNASGQSYWINETNGTGRYSLFEFTQADNYSYFEIWVKMINISHAYTKMTLQDTQDDEIVSFNITNTNIVCYNAENGILWTEVLPTNTWFKIKTTFNWTDSTVYVETGDTDISGVYEGADADGHLGFNSSNVDDLASVNLTGSIFQASYIYFDDMVISKTTEDEEDETPSERLDRISGENYGALAVLILSVLLVVIVIALVYHVITVSTSKKMTTKEFMNVFIMIAFVLIMLTLIAGLLLAF